MESETHCECDVVRDDCPRHFFDGSPSERRRDRATIAALAVAIIFLVCLFLASTAEGQAPTSTAIPSPTTSSSDGSDVGDTASLSRGDRAPWDGVLVRPDDLFGIQRTAFELQFRLDGERQLRLDADAAHGREMSAAAAACTERIDLRTSLWEARATELTQQLVTARSREGPQWYESIGFGFAIGVVLTVVAVVALAYAVHT